MRRGLILFLAALPALLSAQHRSVPEPAALVLARVTVIDTTGAAPKPDMTVLIRGDRIAAVGRSGQVAVPAGAQVVDASGNFLIPGLWDMHVHTLRQGRPEMFFPLFVANGVTGVRDMGGDLLAQMPGLRRRAGEGASPGPRLIAPGPVLDGPKQASPASIAVANGADARAAVRRLKQSHADFIKVYSLLPRDAYMAVASECQKQGLAFAGHVPYSVSAAEASDAGQKSIEHLSGVLLACSSAEEVLRRELSEAVLGPDSVASLPGVISAQTRRVLDGFSEEKASALFARFVRNGTWHCPTLVVLQAFAFMDDDVFTSDPRLRYIPRSMRQRWNPHGPAHAGTSAAEDFSRRKEIFRKELEITGRMHRAGVAFLAGNDAPTPYVFPGFSLHDELALLVRAGLTPLQALQSATRDATRYLGMQDSFGTVEKGKVADLVLLEGNPLVDIANTRKIAAVILAGRLIEKPSLQEMLARVEREAEKN